MTGTATKGEKWLITVSGCAHLELAQDVISELGTEVLSSTAYDFANGETYVRFDESARDCDVFVVQPYGSRVNDWLMEQPIMVNAPKRAFVKRITMVVPFFPCAHQDKKHLRREPISTHLVTDLYKIAGIDRLVGVGLYISQERGLLDDPWDHLRAQSVLVDYACTRVDPANIAVVSPDIGRIRMAERWVNQFGDTSLAFVHETRDVTRPNESTANRVVGDVKGRSYILVDDMIDTGGTIAEAVQVSLNSRAKDVIAVTTHGVLFGPTMDRPSTCGIREAIVIDTLPIPAGKRLEQLTVLSIAPLLARAIKAVLNDGPVAELFDTVGVAGS